MTLRNLSIRNIFHHKKNIILIVQCRLSSTRLPRKALLTLGGKTVLEWVLLSMHQVPCNKYYLATDTDSASELEPIARKCGWDFFAGSKDDVLDRFCKVIELSKADVVIRATADNPFLFYEAATALLDEYKRREDNSPVDYITFTGLPHGSGVEMFNAKSLLKARDFTDLPFDHEHVGPALYNHQDKFIAVFQKAPSRWYYPDFRTTIDTPTDYRKALAITNIISGNQKVIKPYTTEEILNALKNPSVKNLFLLIPSTVKGHGTGHLRRCLEIAIKTGADILVPQNATLEQSRILIDDALQQGLQSWQIVNTISSPEQYSLIVTDLFISDNTIRRAVGRKCPIVSIDEGRENTDDIDYLLDIIPSYKKTNESNLIEPGFIPLPEKRRPLGSKPSTIHTAVVTLGGEDPSGLSIPAAVALAECSIYVSVIVSDKEKTLSLIPERNKKFINVLSPIDNLRNKLCEYDLVVTHYGFTAYEAGNAGCAVILLGTTELHVELAEKYGFACIHADRITSVSIKKLIDNPDKLYHPVEKRDNINLPEFIRILSTGQKLSCPVCRTFTNNEDILIARTPQRTFRKCRKCGMTYISWTIPVKETIYNRSYFYEEYEKQYGKTYLEDFNSIKAQCVRRIGFIDFIYRKNHSIVTPTVLDIGCAMGPFLDAANDSGWQVFGTDISSDAVEYVQNTLHFPAVCSKFPMIDSTKEFGMDHFNAVTMWYVIEHFQNLDEVLRAVSGLLVKKGVFAFSTPSGSGMSCRYNKTKFFNESPSDHYSILEPKVIKSILSQYGFKVIKIVSTGIHPERLPIVQKFGWKKNSIIFSIITAICKLNKLGDTFEVYCKKVKDCEKKES